MLYIVIISVMIVEEICGGKICWFYKKIWVGEECRGRMRRFIFGIVRFFGGDINFWVCIWYWMRVYCEVNSFCVCLFFVYLIELS